MKSVRSAAVALSALMFVAAAAVGAPVRAAEAPKALSPWDAQLYAAAFDAVKRGDFASAAQNTARVSDKSLLGFVEFQKLFHPTAYTATYAELMAWLEKYSDLPGAQRVRALAAKRKPAEASVDPTAAAAAPAARTWESIDAVLSAVQSGERIDPLTPKAGREALNAGDLTSARRLAVEVGDWWVAGLAAWRQRDYDEAYRRFEMIALDVTEDPWVRSGGAYWAARAAVAKGEPHKAPDLLRVAAQYPHTFYGMIAERQLGLEPALRTGPLPYAPQPYAPQPAVVRTASGSADFASPALQQLIKTNPRAKRAVALAQLGQTADAGLELRAGMQAARGEQERADWTALAMALNGQLSASRARDVVDARDYPTPDLGADVPFTVDKALLYALMRRESRFEPTAQSSVGAYGLMQVMPSTAAWLVGDDKLQKKPELLFDPNTNLRVGQAYIAYLAGQGPVANDLLRVIAAYNGGPARVMETARQLGPDADVLTFIESIQVPQTRVYVEEVMAAYWTYRRIFGQDTKSLDAVASGAKLVDLRLDTQGEPAAPAAQFISTAALVGGQK